MQLTLQRYKTRVALSLVAVLAVAFYLLATYPAARVWGANTHSIDLEKDSSQYLDTADSAALSTTGNFTIEAWVKLETQPSGENEQYTIASKYNAAGNQRSYAMTYQNAASKRLVFHVSSDGTNVTTATINHTLSTATWTHLAWVYTAASGQVEIFVDGSSIGTVTSLPTSIVNSTATFIVGALDGSSVTSFFDGLIDDVRVWNIARTAVEISDDRSRELNGNETGLVAYWKLNNALTDTTVNGHTLTNNGSAVFSSSAPFTESTEALKVRKTTNESVANSTVLQNDDQLKLTLLSNKSYIIEGVIFAAASTTAPDLQIAFFAPTGSTVTIGYTNEVNEAVLTSGATSSEIALPANTPTSVHIKGTVKTTGTSGDLQLKWSQDNANGNPTTVMQGSFLKADAID